MTRSGQKGMDHAMTSAGVERPPSDSPTRNAISFCRICSGGCGVVLEIDGSDRIVGVRGDKESPLTRGYLCFKGRQAEASHHGARRLLRPLKRTEDGSYVEISSEQALEEIAAKLGSILDRHGPEAMAAFLGNGVLFNTPGMYMLTSFLTAFDSDQYFSTHTIDQSGKMVTAGRLGAWAAGYPPLGDMEVAIFFGTNPLVSHGAIPVLQSDPVRTLRRAREAGLKVITVDPRSSETAQLADIALQPYPGQDAAIAGGLIRLILTEGWEDKEFCTRWVGATKMAELRRAVEPLNESYVEQRAGLDAGSLRRVAEMFARDARIGSVTSGTGTSMAPFSNLSFHLIEMLNVICGRYLRAGQPIVRGGAVEWRNCRMSFGRAEIGDADNRTVGRRRALGSGRARQQRRRAGQKISPRDRPVRHRARLTPRLPYRHRLGYRIV